MNVRVNLNYPIYDGAEIVFKAPCGASKVTGLVLYYPSNGGTASSVFAFADAHTNDLGDLDDLFAEGAVVKVILDTETNMAFVQNAATNGYLERRFASIGAGGGGGGTVKNAVLYTEQDLSEKEQAQARKNIGAAADCGLEQPVWGKGKAPVVLLEVSNDERNGFVVPMTQEEYDDLMVKVTHGIIVCEDCDECIPADLSQIKYISYDIDPNEETRVMCFYLPDDHYSGGKLTLFGEADEIIIIPGEYTGLGDIAAALDHIIAIQENLIGGGGK